MTNINSNNTEMYADSTNLVTNQHTRIKHENNGGKEITRKMPKVNNFHACKFNRKIILFTATCSRKIVLSAIY